MKMASLKMNIGQCSAMVLNTPLSHCITMSIIRERERVLHYGTVLQHLTGDNYDLCNIIHRQSGFTDCPETSHIIIYVASTSSALQYMRFSHMPTSS